MVRLLDLPSAIAILLSATALASPLPQYYGGPNADQMNRIVLEAQAPATVKGPPIRRILETHSRMEARQMMYTTLTKIEYTRDFFTSTLTPAATIGVSTTLSSLTHPDVLRLKTETDTFTASFGTPAATISSQLPFTVLLSQNASATTALGESAGPPPPMGNATNVSFSNSTSLPPTTNATTTLLSNLTITLPTTVSSTTILSSIVTNLTAVNNSLVFSAPATAVERTSATSSTATVLSASICGPSAIAPAPTNEGTVGGCTWWYVAQTGDYCDTVAQQFGLDVDTFMAWNPSVLPPTCPQMLTGDAYCVEACPPLSSSSVASPATSTASPTPPTLGSIVTTQGTISTTPSPSIPLSSSTAATLPTVPTSAAGEEVAYRSYTGDGTAAAGWPTEDQWIDFDTMFTTNTPDMLTGCQAWGVPDNSPREIADMREQILDIGDATGIDPRFILAIIMQESTGCVRVITTAWSHANPGLMQSFNGTGSCNTNSAPLGLPGVVETGIVQTPCPESEIRQQILDGTNGTVWGPGLVQDMAEQGVEGDASRWYRTARLYNGGSIVDRDLALPCCTASYASDVANRLVGWVNGPRTFDG